MRHTTITSLGLVCLLVALTLAGCSDEEDDPSPDDGANNAAVNNAAPTSYTADGYCTAFYTALCERQIGCNVALVNQNTDIDACVADARRTCEPLLAAWTASVDGELAAFESDDLVSCRDAIEVSSCKSLSAGQLPETCRTVFSGDGVNGDECFTDVECERGLICATAGQCPGVCRPPSDDPEAIDCALATCPEGEYCSGSTCKPQLDQNDRCQRQGDCLDDLFCGKDVGEPDLLCRPKKANGEICFSRAECQEGLSCQITGEGERACMPSIAEDESCIDTNHCAPGLICEPSGAICVPPQQEEAVCFTNDDCVDGLYCWDFDFEGGDGDPNSGLCREDGKVGIAEDEVCNPAIDRCRLGLYCRLTEDNPEVGRCTLLPTSNENCADFSFNLNEECRSGVCVKRGMKFECIDLKEPGEACRTREECISGACVESVCAPFEETICAP